MKKSEDWSDKDALLVAHHLMLAAKFYRRSETAALFAMSVNAALMEYEDDGESINAGSAFVEVMDSPVRAQKEIDEDQ